MLCLCASDFFHFLCFLCLNIVGCAPMHDAAEQNALMAQIALQGLIAHLVLS